MKDINLPPFYVSQRVVALVNGIEFFKKGKEYVVAVMFLTDCCNTWKVGCFGGEVNINEPFKCACGASPKIVNVPYHVMRAALFAPIQENFQSITYEKVMEEESKLISVN